MPRLTRIALVHGALVLFALALVVRAGQVQLLQRAQWAARAERQHFASSAVPAPRGNIYDVRGTPLATSREMLRLSVAPREVASPKELRKALSGLGVPRSAITRALDTHRAWVPLPGSFQPGDVRDVVSLRGVYSEPIEERVYTERLATRRVVGWVDDRAGQAHTGAAGLELTLDSLLSGIDGRTTLARDSRGRSMDPTEDDDVEPVAGASVKLTINQELQEISQRALAQAIERTRADGGDIVIIDPHDGGIRAMASERVGERSFGSPVISEPFEPGSTVKPLFASALLERGLAHPDDSVDTENGVYTIEGRTIDDEHPASSLSLADVIKYSSNIGIVKFVSRMSHGMEYEVLRDFGFGMATGIALPGEASGVLRLPSRWSRQSAASLAMGYELSVTPLQLATAYAAVANGGELLQPAIVQEIRGSDGKVVYSHSRQVVRRVMTPEVAGKVRRMLMGVVKEGTARGAALVNYTLGGKTGTARRVDPGHGYSGKYTASFVGLFPAEDPEYVILVKVDGPRETIYGATAAAPVLKIVLEAAIASRDAALDRRSLATRASFASVDDSIPSLKGDTVEYSERAEEIALRPGAEPVRFDLPFTATRDSAQGSDSEPRAIPRVEGLPLRQAVRELHRAGFRVRLSGAGTASGTSPEAGERAAPGTVVRLRASR